MPSNGLEKTFQHRVHASAWLIRRAQELHQVNEDWLDQAPVSVQKVLRKGNRTVNLALMEELIAVTGHKDKELVNHFCQGFKIAGDIPKSGLWPGLSEAKKTKGKISLDEVIQNVHSCNVKAEMRHGPSDESPQLWKATLKDLDQEWAEGPFESMESVNKHLGVQSIHEMPRFAITTPRPTFVDQGDGTKTLVFENKTRAIDDGSASMVNDATIVSERMVCSSPDTVAAQVRYAKEKFPGHELAGGAEDQSMAYRTIPVHPEDLRFTVPSVWNEEKQKQVWVVLLGHPFGLIAAVHNFCRFSAFIRHVMHALGWVPADYFFDDHWVIEPTEIIQSGLGMLQLLFQCLGFETATEKSQDDAELVILGVRFDLKCSPPEVGIPDLKKAKWSRRIQEILEQGRLTPAEAGKLRGAFQWAVSYMFHQEGRSELHEITKRQYLIGPGHEGFALGKRLRKALERLLEIMGAAVPRPLVMREPKGNHFLLYTDGMQEEGQGFGIGGMIIPPQSEPGCSEWFCGEVPTQAILKWKAQRKTQIVNIEAYALLSALEIWGKRLPVYARIIVFIDNRAVWAMCCKNAAREEDTNHIIRKINNVIVQKKMFVWFEWVESKANISDGPSRWLSASPGDKTKISKEIEFLRPIQVASPKFPNL